MRLFQRYPELKTIIAHTRTDKSFRGVLWQKRRDYLVLRGARILLANGETRAVDGELVIHQDNIDYLQVV
jgi:IS5 family transposase